MTCRQTPSAPAVSAKLSLSSLALFGAAASAARLYSATHLCSKSCSLTFSCCSMRCWSLNSPSCFGVPHPGCADVRTVYAPTQQTLYLLAEDNLPTYKGWTSSCSMPIVAAAPPGPCARITVGRCINTPPAAEQVNQQAPPFAAVDLSNAAAAGPPLQPLKGVITVTDPVAAGFAQASINTTGASLVFRFQTTKPGLVQWRLVEQVTVEVANGYVPVRDPSAAQQVAVSRKCNGQQLVLGTAYAMWFNMTDVYGRTTDISILKVVM
eukprot:GHRQ01017208.1.p1 GENE.GHRQ01017208.1~~GHRQ01017208.1.p1  ORF type:complete len:266 (-),score=55.56 GHRQ01017208.1:285-1082(-)